MTIEKNDVLRSKISYTKLRLRTEIVNFSTPDKHIMMIRQELKNYCQQLNILEQKQSIISNDIYRKLILITSIILISVLFFISYKFGQIALQADDYRSAALVNRCGNLPGEELNPIEFIQKSAQRQKCLARKIMELLSN